MLLSRATLFLLIALLAHPPRAALGHQASRNANQASNELPYKQDPQLLETLLRIGYGREKEAQAAMTELNQRVDAVEAIRELYRRSPKEELELRWLALNTLASLQDDRSADFLAQVALQALPSPPTQSPLQEPPTHGEQGCSMAGINGTDADYLYPEWGAGALASKVARSGYASQGLQRLMKQVLKYADPEIAKAAAGSLFGQHALRESHKKILDARGIFHEFRFLTPQEQAELFDASKIGHDPPSEDTDSGTGGDSAMPRLDSGSTSTAAPDSHEHSDHHIHTR